MRLCTGLYYTEAGGHSYSTLTTDAGALYVVESDTAAALRRIFDG
jgi:hypothetical protein